MKFYLTGDKHGRFDSILNRVDEYKGNAIVVLGDAGLNYYLNKTDNKLKQKLNDSGIMFYLVRGNHEVRPEDIPTMEIIEDPHVLNKVYCEPEFPNIRYFMDGGHYYINGYSCLVIGGAYSVDKEYRLLKRMAWFENEQLSKEEMHAIEDNVKDKHFHFVLTHTAPLDYEPRYLFLDFIDQSKVDKSMENWLNEFKDKIKWDVWCFGHYHGDIDIEPNVCMLYYNVYSFDKVYTQFHPRID